ncbi:MAG: hypothetical protein HYY84_19980 [Deltaproteobacteria bacterium]|nr:hypothetical protein [Deltaproteobacteria bacterium]
MRILTIAVFACASLVASPTTANAESASFGIPWRIPLVRLSKHFGRDAMKGFLRPLVHGYIEFMRDVALKDAQPLTTAEKKHLAEFFPLRLIDRVRVTLLGVAGLGNSSAGAAAYGPDLIVVKRGHRTLAVLKHEMVHICQYDKLGIAAFAQRYAEQLVDTDFVYGKVPFEVEAHRFTASGRGRFSGILGSCE